MRLIKNERWPLPRKATIAAIIAIAAVVVIVRRLDAFTNPQFFAEDGARWFTDAYTHGAIRALGLSYAGYFQVISRLAPVIAAPFGILHEPLIYNIFGLLVQLAPVFYFLSSRFDTVVPNFWVRVILSAVYLLMPAYDLNVDITGAPFNLAILATLVVIAPEPKRWYWKTFDVTVVLLCGFSGPFAYVLFPVTLLCFLIRRRRFTLLLCVLFALALAAQFYASRLAPRPQVDLGASLSNLVLIVCDRIILAGMFAEPGHRHVYVAGRPHGTVIAIVICLLALPVVVYAARKAPWELKLFGLVSLGIVAGGLLSPLAAAQGNQWLAMATTGAAGRYFFMARIIWVVTLIWAASRLPRVWAKRTAWSIAAVAFVSGFPAWGYALTPDYHWPHEARTIETSPPGTKLVLPIPPGGPWSIDITVA